MANKVDKEVRIGLRASETFHKRLKMAAVQAGVPMAVFIEQLLDQHEQRATRARAAQPSPLHRLPQDG